jgi:hypothetical protein
MCDYNVSGFGCEVQESPVIGHDRLNLKSSVEPLSNLQQQMTGMKEKYLPVLSKHKLLSLAILRLTESTWVLCQEVMLRYRQLMVRVWLKMIGDLG